MKVRLKWILRPKVRRTITMLRLQELQKDVIKQKLYVIYLISL